MRIVILHAGGIGDIVLAETLFSAMRERHPGARVELVCRLAVAPVSALYQQPPDAIHTFDFNPYQWAVPDDAVAPLRGFLANLGSEPVDLFISAELRATWAGEVLAAALDAREGVIADPRTNERSIVRILLRRLGLRRNARIRRGSTIEGEHELGRYARLAGGSSARRPALRPLRNGVSDGPFLVVFPLGVPALKRWPFPAFVAAARAIAAPRGFRIVLVGNEEERVELKALVAADSGSPALEIVETDDDLAAIASVIANADGYLAIDTGLAHLAAAYGVPGVTVYGGGTWPSYAPWAPRSAGVVAPIPCFRCWWDCAFDHAFCITPIGVDDVVRAFDAAVAASSESALTLSCEAYQPQERTILERAAQVYRGGQEDRAARLRAIVRLKDVFERYSIRSRARQQAGSAALDSFATRLAATVKRLEEETAGPG